MTVFETAHKFKGLDTSKIKNDSTKRRFILIKIFFFWIPFRILQKSGKTQNLKNIIFATQLLISKQIFASIG